MNRQELSDQLIIDEKLCLKPYIDTVGKTSIGVGRNLTDRGILKSEALQMLENDIIGVESDLDRELPWWRQMSEKRQQALGNMCFNLGIVRLLGFKNALAAMRNGDFSRARKEMLDSRWADQVGNRARRLAKMIEKG